MNTSFVNMLGNNPTVRVLDFLIENDRESWSLQEISRNARVGYSTLKIIIPSMHKQGIITPKRKIGKINLYGMNNKDKIVRKLYEVYNEINMKSVVAKKIKAVA